jgi:Pre-toxin TG
MKLIVKIIFLLACLPLQAQISGTIYSGAPNHAVSSGNHHQEGNRKKPKGLTSEQELLRAIAANPLPSPPPQIVSEEEKYKRALSRQIYDRVQEKRTKVRDLYSVVSKMTYPGQRTELLNVADYALIVTGGEAETIINSPDDQVADYLEAAQMYQSFADQAMDIAVSLTPVVGTSRDFYEAILGKDLLTGKTLGGFERTLSVLGIFTGGVVKATPKVAKMLISIAAHLGNGKYKPFEKAVEVYNKVVYRSEKGVREATNYYERMLANEVYRFDYAKALSELKETVGFLKRSGVRRVDLVDFTNAFKPGAKTRVLKEDLKVYRYYDKAKPGSNPRGNWVSVKPVSNPVEELALKFDGDYEMVEWIIPKGTEILEGIVAPNWNRAGGAAQIFINKDLLK